MISNTLIRSALIASSLAFAAPALAIDGEILITQQRALNGNVTPGDSPGFPVTLSVQGSYKLASNLFPGNNRDGIHANANDITVDLNGFLISGGPATRPETNSRSGIVGRADRLTVRNGMINSMRFAGIFMPDLNYLTVDSMRIIQSVDGIFNPNGGFTLIQNSVFAANANAGIQCGASCLVQGSVISSNGGAGVALLSGTVLGNTIERNAGIGIQNDFGADVGFGNNTLVFNGTQFTNGRELIPNHCLPAQPPC